VYGTEQSHSPSIDLIRNFDDPVSQLPDQGDHAWNPIHQDSHIHEDWGTAPVLAAFYGRNPELGQLEQRIRIDGCRLLVLYGLPGVGKSKGL
jgi:hypothetical protein